MTLQQCLDIINAQPFPHTTPPTAPRQRIRQGQKKQSNRATKRRELCGMAHISKGQCSGKDLLQAVLYGVQIFRSEPVYMHNKMLLWKSTG